MIHADSRRSRSVCRSRVTAYGCRHELTDGAKRLLADAGYPNGFELTMHRPNDRYVNDAAICQAVATNLARVGIKVNLQTETKTIATSHVDSRKFEEVNDARSLTASQRVRKTHFCLPRR